MNPVVASRSVNQPSVGQPDLEAVKARQQAAWGCGDYAVIGTTLQIVGEQLLESAALDVRAGQTVLDVAAGNGNTSLAAARRGCDVVATDYVRALLERAPAGRRRRAHHRVPRGRRGGAALSGRALRRGRLHLRSDVHASPGSCRRGAGPRLQARGKIGLANWTPEGFIGQVFKAIGTYLPPPPGVKSPALWGTPERIAELFGAMTVDTPFEAYRLASSA